MFINANLRSGMPPPGSLSWLPEGYYRWHVPARWYSLAEYHWYTVAECAWYILGEYPWRILGECTWYIIGRSVTKAVLDTLPPLSASETTPLPAHENIRGNAYYQ